MKYLIMMDIGVLAKNKFSLTLTMHLYGALLLVPQVKRIGDSG